MKKINPDLTDLGVGGVDSFNAGMVGFRAAKPVVSILRPPKSYMLVRFEKKK